MSFSYLTYTIHAKTIRIHISHAFLDAVRFVYLKELHSSSFAIPKHWTMKGLNNLSQFLRYFRVYNQENFHGNRREIIRHCCDTLDISISLLQFGVFNVLIFRYWMDENYRISSPSLPTFIIANQTLFSFISFVVSNRIMTAAIEHLRLVIIEKSEHNYPEN